MRISELSERTGATVATLKFYLREGVLHSGTALSRTQAAYDESHVARVRLIRALMDTGDLSVSAARRVIDVLTDPPARHELLGTAQRALVDQHPVPGSADLPQVQQWISDRGWQCHPDDPLVTQLAAQIGAARSAGLELTDEQLDGYADGAELIAATDVASVPLENEAAIHRVVVGTVMLDPVLRSLRRLAQQHQSALATGRRGR